MGPSYITVSQAPVTVPPVTLVSTADGTTNYVTITPEPLPPVTVTDVVTQPPVTQTVVVSMGKTDTSVMTVTFTPEASSTPPVTVVVTQTQTAAPSVITSMCAQRSIFFFFSVFNNSNIRHYNELVYNGMFRLRLHNYSLQYCHGYGGEDYI